MHATKNITSLSKVTITGTSGIIQYTLAEVHLFKCFIMQVGLSEPADLLGVLLRSQGLKRKLSSEWQIYEQKCQRSEKNC